MNRIEDTICSLACSDFELAAGTTFSELEERLQEKIVYLLQFNFEGLWNILYRIDVKEERVKKLFDQPDPKLIAPGLATLILERLRQKAETRLRYR